jgi:hypothetical protein
MVMKRSSRKRKYLAQTIKDRVSSPALKLIRLASQFRVGKMK